MDILHTDGETYIENIFEVKSSGKIVFSDTSSHDPTHGGIHGSGFGEGTLTVWVIGGWAEWGVLVAIDGFEQSGLVGEASSPLADAQVLAERLIGIIRLEDADRYAIHSLCEDFGNWATDSAVVGERGIIEICQFVVADTEGHAGEGAATLIDVKGGTQIPDWELGFISVGSESSIVTVDCRGRDGGGYADVRALVHAEAGGVYGHGWEVGAQRGKCASHCCAAGGSERVVILR